MANHDFDCLCDDCGAQFGEELILAATDYRERFDADADVWIFDNSSQEDDGDIILRGDNEEILARYGVIDGEPCYIVGSLWQDLAPELKDWDCTTPLGIVADWLEEHGMDATRIRRIAEKK